MERSHGCPKPAGRDQLHLAGKSSALACTSPLTVRVLPAASVRFRFNSSSTDPPERPVTRMVPVELTARKLVVYVGGGNEYVTTANDTSAWFDCRKSYAPHIRGSLDVPGSTAKVAPTAYSSPARSDTGRARTSAICSLDVRSLPEKLNAIPSPLLEPLIVLYTN